MAVYDLFASDWGDLQLASPTIGDRTNSGSLSRLEQQIRQLVENPLPEMRTYLDALPDHQVETLIIKLLIAMGIESGSIGLVLRYERKNGVLISGRWNTIASGPVDVLIRITHRALAVSGNDLVQMLTGRDSAKHLIVFTPRTWLENTTTQTAPRGTAKVHFVDRVQLLALFMRYGVGSHKKVVEIHAFDQGLWLDDVNAASVAYSMLLSEPNPSESSTAKSLSASVASAPNDAEAAALYWDIHDACAGSDITPDEACPEWPDILQYTDLDMPWPDVNLEYDNPTELSNVFLDISEDGRSWDEPEWPDTEPSEPVDYENDPAEFLSLEDTYLDLEFESGEGWGRSAEFEDTSDSAPWSETAFWERDEIPDANGEGNQDCGRNDLSSFTYVDRPWRRFPPLGPGAVFIPHGQTRRDGMRDIDMTPDSYDDW